MGEEVETGRRGRRGGGELIGKGAFLFEFGLTLVLADGCLKADHFETSFLLLFPCNEINLFSLLFSVLKGQKPLFFPSGIPHLWICMSSSKFQGRPKPTIPFVS